MGTRDRSPAHGNLASIYGTPLLTCTYANLPAASRANSGRIAMVTDIGLSPGTPFFSNGTSWLQVGVAVLAVNTSNITYNSGSASGSFFNTAPTLPNGCLAIGSVFSWDARINLVDAGSDDASAVYTMKIGSTDVGNLTYAAFGEYNYTKGIFKGEMVVRTLGAGGTVMGTMDYGRWTSGLNAWDSVSSGTATTVDTTGSISPDVTIALANFVNNGARTVIEARMFASGLAK